MTLRSPLQWPQTFRRQPYRARSPFKVPLSQARKELYAELERLGASEVYITTSAKLNLDGSIAARQPFGTDPAVAVYFTRKGREFCIPCDMFETIDGNLRAVGLTLANIRAQERWGTSQIVDAMFQGFAALPAQSSGGSCWDVLGIAPDASRAAIEAAYRNLARVHHPDKAGNEHMFKLVTEAYQQALASASHRNGSS